MAHIMSKNTLSIVHQSDGKNAFQRLRAMWRDRKMEEPYKTNRMIAAIVGAFTIFVAGGIVSAANGGVMGEVTTTCTSVGNLSGSEALQKLGDLSEKRTREDDERDDAKALELGSSAMACISKQNLVWPIKLAWSDILSSDELPANTEIVEIPR